MLEVGGQLANDEDVHSRLGMWLHGAPSVGPLDPDRDLIQPAPTRVASNPAGRSVLAPGPQELGGARLQEPPQAAEHVEGPHGPQQPVLPAGTVQGRMQVPATDALSVPQGAAEEQLHAANEAPGSLVAAGCGCEQPDGWDGGSQLWHIVRNWQPQWKDAAQEGRIDPLEVSLSMQQASEDGCMSDAHVGACEAAAHGGSGAAAGVQQGVGHAVITGGGGARLAGELPVSGGSHQSAAHVHVHVSAGAGAAGSGCASSGAYQSIGMHLPRTSALQDGDQEQQVLLPLLQQASEHHQSGADVEMAQGAQQDAAGPLPGGDHQHAAGTGGEHATATAAAAAAAANVTAANANANGAARMAAPAAGLTQGPDAHLLHGLGSSGPLITAPVALAAQDAAPDAAGEAVAMTVEADAAAVESGAQERVAPARSASGQREQLASRDMGQVPCSGAQPQTGGVGSGSASDMVQADVQPRLARPQWEPAGPGADGMLACEVDRTAAPATAEHAAGQRSGSLQQQAGSVLHPIPSAPTSPFGSASRQEGPLQSYEQREQASSSSTSAVPVSPDMRMNELRHPAFEAAPRFIMPRGRGLGLYSVCAAQQPRIAPVLPQSLAQGQQPTQQEEHTADADANQQPPVAVSAPQLDVQPGLQAETASAERPTANEEAACIAAPQEQEPPPLQQQRSHTGTGNSQHTHSAEHGSAGQMPSTAAEVTGMAGGRHTDVPSMEVAAMAAVAAAATAPAACHVPGVQGQQGVSGAPAQAALPVLSRQHNTAAGAAQAGSDAAAGTAEQLQEGAPHVLGVQADGMLGDAAGGSAAPCVSLQDPPTLESGHASDPDDLATRRHEQSQGARTADAPSCQVQGHSSHGAQAEQQQQQQAEALDPPPSHSLLQLAASLPEPHATVSDMDGLFHLPHPMQPWQLHTDPSHAGLDLMDQLVDTAGSPLLGPDTSGEQGQHTVAGGTSGLMGLGLHAAQGMEGVLEGLLAGPSAVHPFQLNQPSMHPPMLPEPFAGDGVMGQGEVGSCFMGSGMPDDMAVQGGGGLGPLGSDPHPHGSLPHRFHGLGLMTGFPPQRDMGVLPPLHSGVVPNGPGVHLQPHSMQPSYTPGPSSMPHEAPSYDDQLHCQQHSRGTRGMARKASRAAHMSGGPGIRGRQGRTQGHPHGTVNDDQSGKGVEGLEHEMVAAAGGLLGAHGRGHGMQGGGSDGQWGVPACPGPELGLGAPEFWGSGLGASGLYGSELGDTGLGDAELGAAALGGGGLGAGGLGGGGLGGLATGLDENMQQQQEQHGEEQEEWDARVMGAAETVLRRGPIVPWKYPCPAALHGTQWAVSKGFVYHMWGDAMLHKVENSPTCHIAIHRLGVVVDGRMRPFKIRVGAACRECMSADT